ncbi:hypothetical protein [Phascolarctobacterium faecium]|uniref:hypothetical protein n=1 Tax=Phascolarctobacterium faecium TaxID=33025 RepID=UPI003AB12BF5
MRTQSNYMGKAKLQKKVLTTIMTGFLFAGISNTALAENVSVPDSKTDGQTIGAGNTAAGDGWSVEVGSDNNKSVYSVGDKNAISLRDNATIHIKKKRRCHQRSQQEHRQFWHRRQYYRSPFRF